MRKVKLLIIGLLAMTVVACGSSNKPSIELKKKEFVIEYGDTVSEDAKDYVKADKDVLKETVVSFKDVKYENRKVDGKDIKYLEVGTYKATAVYKDETLDFKIVVKDTTAPEFVNFKDTIEVEVGYLDDFTEFYKATDLSEVTITVDHEYVDWDMVGEDTATVIAEDAYGNKTERKITVIIKDKATATQENDQQSSQESQNGSADTSNGGTQGSSGGSASNTSGGTTSGNGDGSTTSSNPTPTPTEAVVQLTPTPTGSPIFETQEEAVSWVESICATGESNRNYTASLKLGYTMITNWYPGTIQYGYASTGQVVYIKYVIIFTFQ
ncbi:hypothetical protein [Breznakia pachnodae]|uniref:Uncharacterized protein n=1 Tax=Breznakia pachnodae TaxID=265178 RepID=A0ABU0E6L0_9FIRM|nr:hypothetical protein [Breznakia pachnodae]MDQ0362544.1 hypothetical protein [Breznakia pachnodae]